MKTDPRSISKLTSALSYWAATKVIASAAMGAAFVLVAVKSNEISALDSQPFRGLRHESTVINQTNHLCSVCGQEKLASEFASKGKGRLSRLCRECDNDRRRSSYKPRTSRNCRSEVTVIFEAHEEQQVHGVMMIFDLLTEHGLILTGDLKSDDDPTVDQLIRRKSVIHEIT